MTTKDLFEKVNSVADARQKAYTDELTRVMDAHETLLNDIAVMQPRVKELCVLANLCLSKGIDIGQKDSTRDDVLWHHQTDRTLLTDGVNHIIGFVVDYRGDRSIIGIGMDGGGCCCWDTFIVRADGSFNCDAHLHTFRRTLIDAYRNENRLMRDFIKGFDEFEVKVEKFISNLK